MEKEGVSGGIRRGGGYALFKLSMNDLRQFSGARG